ncbi:AMP-binding protein [Geobacter pickeringii]|uniref:AMP-dependent synthetase n=1 Tax=Geobacter pickeringii TaxID=345632 RepID=A0A0B5BHX2_9BACT|nr:AMP-binding protein [Geobacter pickeringii]AJE04769.1 hypothetical protein GPICK_01135 [Geobacter pickeringii]
MTAPVPATIGDLLGVQARRRESSPFLHDPAGGRTISFGTMAAYAGRIEEELTASGFCPGDRVAIMLQNGVEAAAAILGVMGAGGVVVPINPRMTAKETARILSLSAPLFIIMDGAHRPQLGTSLDGSWVDLTSHGMPELNIRILARLRAVSVARKRGRIGSDSRALILCTSGTTGMPKGVPLSHGNLLADASFVRDAHRLAPEDTALCVLPFFHINGLVVTLLAPLLTGMPVVVPDRFRSDTFWELVARYGVTWFSGVPTILSLLLSRPDPPAETLRTLRFARSASASLPVAVLDEFERRFGVPVIESYGISEASAQVTTNPLPPQPHKVGSAGLPVGNVIAILGENGAPLPVGKTGEVGVAGPNVFGGYLDNPEADREAFRNGWFHTGDLGYLDADGYLFLTGRKKELINRAGEKISPREVEEVIHRLPEVELASVVGVPHPLYGEEVVAFVIVRPDREIDAERITGFCREHLAGFKVPKEILFVDDFPKGPSGKFQRRRLVDVYLTPKGNP